MNLVRNNPLVIVGASYSLGILLTAHSGTNRQLVLLLVWALLMVGLMGFQQLKRVYIFFCVLALFLSFFSFQVIWKAQYEADPLVQSVSQHRIMEGRLLNKRILSSGDNLLELDRVKVKDSKGIWHSSQGRLQVIVESGGDYRTGTVLGMGGTIYLPAPKRNPGGLDMKKILLQQRIYARVYVKEDEIKVMGYEKPLFFHALRQRYVTAIDDSIPQPYSSVLQALLLGMQDHLDGEIRDGFQKAGLNHILAISGLHIGFISLFVWGILNILPSRVSRFLIFTFFIITYALLAGSRPPVLRASIFTILTAGSTFWQIKSFPLNNLGLTFLIMLIINPYQLWGVGFQLSFVITSFLILGYPVITRMAKGFFPRTIFMSILATLAAAPLTALNFQTINPLNFLGNLWAVPLTGAVVMGSILGFIPVVGPFFWQHVSYPIVFLLCGALEVWQEFPGTMIYVPSPPVIICILFYGVLGILLYCAHPEGGGKFPRRVYAVLIIAAIVFMVFLVFQPATEDPLQIVFFDVGQGDAIYLQIPCGTSMLIDGGGTRDEGGDWPGRLVILPYLRHKGIKSLDYIFISHFHEDHYRGLLPVIEEMPVELVLGPPLIQVPQEQEVFAVLAEQEVPYLPLIRGMTMTGEKWFLEVLHPGDSFIQESVLNNNSLVMNFHYQEWRILFTGDIEAEAEAELIEKDLLSPVHLLKVAHHGSLTSTGWDFLDLVNPDVAVICVGGNPFGHPAPDVLKRLEARGVKTFKTMSSGAIKVNFFMDRMEIWEFLGR